MNFKSPHKNYHSQFTVLIAGLFILGGLSACSHSPSILPGTPSNTRGPSSLDLNSSCAELILPIVDEYRTLRPERWQASELARQDYLDEEQLESFKASEEWQRFISREGQSDEEREMGFIVLSMLKKRYPRVDDGRLKDRYRVLMAFCGD